MDDMVSLVSNVGFPIAITIFLLIRMEKKVDGLSTSISKLSTSVEKLIEKI
ncbi:YvrJ family protein [Clostridium frigidicarnis]|uniref:YvrJ family protein n=1 Tax=Clostridium frigidicarnis TaxID=84698 RepID=UPI000AB99ACA|nr:YvrJ family protein [Clostridium frigidicarnis]